MHSPEVPSGLTGRALTAWAKDRHAAALQQRLDTLDQPIATKEAELNATISTLYRLTPGEIGMVEGG